LTVTERSPKLFDYLAGAILTNGLAMMAIYLAAWELLFQYLLIPLWFVAAGVSSYLVCMRTTKNHLITGIKTAVISIVMGFFMVPTLQNIDLGSLFIILICYIIGSIGGAYYALREQLKRKKKAAISPPNIEP
jgi:hypothetical protein